MYETIRGHAIKPLIFLECKSEFSHVRILSQFYLNYLLKIQKIFTSTEWAIFVWALFATKFKICPFLDYHWIIDFVIHSFLHTVHVFCSGGRATNSLLVMWYISRHCGHVKEILVKITIRFCQRNWKIPSRTSNVEAIGKSRTDEYMSSLFMFYK